MSFDWTFNTRKGPSPIMYMEEEENISVRTRSSVIDHCAWLDRTQWTLTLTDWTYSEKSRTIDSVAISGRQKLPESIYRHVGGEKWRLAVMVPGGISIYVLTVENAN